ncbi:ATP-binding protein [Roseateles violae]|uniref:Tetratricopeptide repeat protein n=1 Tax=Roseateles violae TaxID=3058042 RepID=A0ABT8DZY4_9BURK|nr:tetratricopeptide repeat protein [Pelomonas sp. PFR6]MDN3923114.1 tetratricopeptide repeat protein [Pelomonas sp. PFR6]
MSELRALLLTDVVDSTHLSTLLGDQDMAALWAAHDRVARDLLPPHGGREIDKTDGMLLLFEQASQALAYARAYHQALEGLHIPLKARAGLHVGPVILRENEAADIARGAKPLEVEGLAKPTAARVMALAKGGQTLLSAAAVQALGELAGEERAQSHGHWQMKGVSEPLELFEVGAGPFSAPPDGEKSYRVARVGERWLPIKAVPNNLPPQATPFLGREREIDEVKRLLEGTRLVEGVRLVTLLGMGGLGKTRLSLQVAAELLGDFPDGAWFLDLAPIRDPALVLAETARLLQVQEEPGQPLLQTLTKQLQNRRLLLVMDNCEHLIEKCAELAHALLRAAPQLRIIASSRIALHVPGEQTYPVLPLPLPGREQSVAELGRLTAVRLFVERARAHKPDFELNEREAPAVAELVARLEGIPLALELAAARVRVLAVADINKRLQDRYKLLTGGSRQLQQRQQTLRALVDWSYELLQPSEQQLLQRLGIFVGGFELAAVEAICGEAPLDPLDVLDLLDSLVEKSLVMLDQQPGGATRYRMLETLRDYAREKLEASGELLLLTRHHLDHFFGLAKQLRDGLQGAQQAEWVERGEADLDNLRVALAAARSGAEGIDPFLAVKLPVALQGFWTMRGYLAEGRETVRAALAMPAIQATDMAHAHALYVGAALAITQGDPAEARRMLETCLALRRRLQDETGVAATLSTLSMALLSIGDAAAARAAEDEALQLFRKLGHRVGEAIALQHLGYIELRLGRPEAAAEQLRLGAALARELENLEVEGECELVLGEVAFGGGELASARQHLERALQLCREAGDKRDVARALASLGRCDLHEGQLPAARERLAEALRAFRAFEMREELLQSLDDHARLAEARGRPAIALALGAAAEQARVRAGLPRPAEAGKAQQQLEQRLSAQLGAVAAEAALQDGRAWTWIEALDRAQSLSAPG